MTGSELHHALTQLRLSQRHFARMIGRDEATVSRWISGAKDLPPYVDMAVDSLRYRAVLNGASNPEAT
jgi:DNA-binding transcriptional regulator YiaG